MPIMTVAELIAALQKFPGDLPVFFNGTEWIQPVVRSLVLPKGSKNIDQHYPGVTGDYVMLVDDEY